MSSLLRVVAAIGLAAVSLSPGLAGSAHADPALPGLTNLNFLSYSGSAPKDNFSNVKPTGWAGGTGLIFIDTPGNASNANSACGSTYLTTYGCPSTLAIPGGYNYVEADGNPSFGTGFNYEVTGLTPGQTYTLTLYQAASQQLGFANGLQTTDQWIVSLGTSGLTVCQGCGAADAYYGGHDSTYSNADSNASIVATSEMTTPSGGLTDWQYVTVTLKADSTSDLLSFLAWGDNGNTVNLPPIVFLTGINSPSGLNNVPEPASLALVGVGMLGLAAGRRYRTRRGGSR
jgi:PEP-CTERM motif